MTRADASGPGGAGGGPDRNTYWRRGVVRLRTLRRTGGVRAVLRWLIGGTVYRRANLYVCDLASVEERRSDLPIRVRRLEERDIPAYLELRPGREAAVTRRFAVGDIGYGGWLEDRLVTVNWARPGRAGIPELGLLVELGPDEVYMYGSFTDPALRGHNVATARSSIMLRGLHELGYRRAVSYIVPEDRSALGPVLKNGYRRTGWVGFVGVRPLRIRFLKEYGRPLQVRLRRHRPFTLAAEGRADGPAARPPPG